ncbi:MAG TPA: sulfatase-like hydrolase/transferase [Bryobacteraceae bacterium]|nr:sulfatase-like hydrolase/transferase [Bryobacteraceae bacterium]
MPLAAPNRPNIVFVLVDDLRWDELGCTGHPFALSPQADRLAREGANFRNAFATTPLCSPSRASFLTGTYPHRHGIIDNTDRSGASHRLVTWPRLLHDEGYETCFVGKWHMGNDDSPRPGFDHWVSFPGQGECVDPVLNVNGKSARAHGYITDLLTERAVEFLKRPRSRPFCLYLAHKAIHPNITQFADGSVNKIGGGTAEDFIPAERHRSLYSGMTPPRRPNYARAPLDKPALNHRIPGLQPLGPGTLIDDQIILNRLRMAKAVDESLGEILGTIERQRKLEDTLVVFTSDHGYFYGEHYLGHERRLAYEETIRIPMLIRYPRVFRAGSQPENFFLSIDVARLFLRQQLPPHRDDFLIEYFSDNVFARIRKMGYQAVRTRRWKYIHYRDIAGADELYDLVDDPYEMRNLIGAPGAPLAEMQVRLAKLSDT